MMHDAATSLLPNDVLRLNAGIVLETFDDGALVLRLSDRHLFELNPTAGYILSHIDGQRTLTEVAQRLAEACEVTPEETLPDVLAQCAEWEQQRILDRINEKETTLNDTQQARYLRNPDVVLREEDPDEGGLLFNPDTNQVKVLNPTGLFIWQQCSERTVDEIAAELVAAFEDVPPDAVTQDVREFVDEMMATGFVGTVEAL